MATNSQAIVSQGESAYEMFHMPAPERDLPAFPLEYFGSFQNVLVEKSVQSGWMLLIFPAAAANSVIARVFL